KAFGPCRRPGGSAILQVENTLQVLGRDSSFSEKKEGANQVAHHVVKESAAANFVDQLLTVAQPLRRKNRADFAAVFVVESFFRIDRGERAEIVLPFYEAGCGDHSCFIERIRIMVHEARQEWRADVGSQNAIPVGLGIGAVTGVKISWHFFGR